MWHNVRLAYKSLSFFSAHQTHYEQIGKARGYIRLKNGAQDWFLDSVATFRDHSYGNLKFKLTCSQYFTIFHFNHFITGTRDWKLMHREVISFTTSFQASKMCNFFGPIKSSRQKRFTVLLLCR